MENLDPKAMFQLTYGLFLLSAREGDKDNACIINTVGQVTEKPLCVQMAVNKSNLTHDMILSTGVFSVSVLTEEVPFAVFERFGFASGRDKDKFEGCADVARAENGTLYLTRYTNAYFGCRVIKTVDCGSHTLFIAEVTESVRLSDVPSVTYAYYFAHIKPQPQRPTTAASSADTKTIYVCRICGYVYEGETLPEDFVCPWCKHGPEDFEKQ